jgi:hypothetical protein
LITDSPKIVDDDSATIGHLGERRQWLDTHHLDMCKFDDPNNADYGRVAGTILEFVEDLAPGEVDPDPIN